MKIISINFSIILACTGIALIGLALIESTHKISQLAQTATAVLAFLIVFSICRAIVLVRGDVGLTALQSEIMVKCTTTQRRAKSKHGN